MFIRLFFEEMLFSPKWYHWPIIILLFPLSLLYGVSMWIRRKCIKKNEYTLPIVSVGNLIVGGTGKTPFVIALVSLFDNVVVISRGYGRKSKGLVEVSHQGKILTDVNKSGDEAMLMALSLPKASVIVSEDRTLAITRAKELGATLIVLDDGFNRVDIKKYEILLEPPKIENYLTFPAGPLREFYFTRNNAENRVKENEGFSREVKIENPTTRMILLTAISNPKRLDEYLPPSVIKKIYYEDHAYFDEEVLKQYLKTYNATSILCTSKDRVKMKGFDIPISEMKLKFIIDDAIIAQIKAYIEQGTHR